jgi:hypothetical protein
VTERVPAPTTAAEFRAFVRTHHPDVGGDPEIFAAGVAAWREESRPAAAVVFYRRRRGLDRILHTLDTLLRAPLRGDPPTDRRLL